MNSYECVNVSENAAAFLDFMNKSPTPFHAVDNIAQKLGYNNFLELSMGKIWSIRPGGKYYILLNRSTVVAFAVGGNYKPGNGLNIIGAHTDSPHLRVKPNPDLVKSGYQMVGLQTYGGGIWHTWFDRDLTMAGIASIKNPSGGVSQRLFYIGRPVLRIPSLAIHLDRTVNDSFAPNTETHLVPVIGLASQDKGNDQVSFVKAIISKEIGVKVEDILDMDICLADTQPSCTGGINNEFIFSPRLDNLFNTYCSVEGFLASLEENGLKEEENIRMSICFDNEEVGSLSFQGAGTKAIANIIEKIAMNLGADYSTTIANSFLLSADQGHAVHPNYSDKHEARHQTGINDGVLIEFNASQKFATTTHTAALAKLISERCNIPYQHSCGRNDIPSGSTIGPIISASLGIRVADVGFPMLSMHSIREMCSTLSVTQAINFYKAYFKEFTLIMTNSD